jgi:C1A family cysteine protease
MAVKNPILKYKTKLPESFDMVKLGYVTPVKQQGTCATCTAFSAVAALEGQYAKLSNQLVSLSEQYLIDCSPVTNMCKNGGLSEIC